MGRREHFNEVSRFMKEIPDPTPIEVPEPRQTTLREELQRYVRQEISQLQQEVGNETFEEADDFDEDDPDPEWASPHEMLEMQDDQEDPANPESLDGTPNQEDQTAKETLTISKESAAADAADPGGQTSTEEKRAGNE